jgi:hypothetical protein
MTPPEQPVGFEDQPSAEFLSACRGRSLPWVWTSNASSGAVVWFDEYVMGGYAMGWPYGEPCAWVRKDSANGTPAQDCVSVPVAYACWPAEIRAILDEC